MAQIQSNYSNSNYSKKLHVYHVLSICFCASGFFYAFHKIIGIISKTDGCFSYFSGIFSSENVT